jgi:FkbM family methyltransferase
MIQYSVTNRRVFRPDRVPAVLGFYDDVSDDVDLYEYARFHRRVSLLKFAARRAARKLTFPWLLRGPWVGASTFFYARDGAETRIEFNPRNAQFGSVYSRRFSGWYEPLAAELLAICIPRDSGVFFDVGANWGHFSLYVASVLGEGVRIHAFEPFPETFQDLERTVLQAGLENRVVRHPIAVGDEEKLVAMTARDGLETGLHEVALQASGNLRCAPLDGLDLPDPDVLKIDVEGFERRVLLGAERMLVRARPSMIFESRITSEADRREAVSTMRLLEQFGYELFEPVWLLDFGDGRVLSRDDRSARSSAHPRFVLRPTSSVERPLLPPYVNLFACHGDKLPLA